MKRLLTILILSISVVVYSQDMKQPIIDIHLHGYSSIPPNVQASWAGESYAQELTSPQNTEMHLQMVIEEMEKNNIKLGVISSTSLEALTKWKATAPELFLSGIQTDKLGRPILSPDSLKILFEKGGSGHFR